MAPKFQSYFDRVRCGATVTTLKAKTALMGISLKELVIRAITEFLAREK